MEQLTVNTKFNKMAYKIFSTRFPKSHKRRGEKTLFVEKIWAGMIIDVHGDLEESMKIHNSMLSYLDNKHNGVLWNLDIIYAMVTDYVRKMPVSSPTIKVSTIRVWDSKKNKKVRKAKEGDVFEPRVWTGKPYDSKQVAFAPNMRIKHVHKFEKKNFSFYTNGTVMTEKHLKVIAYYDGLGIADFLDWFNGDNDLEGQIIIFVKE